MKKWIGTVLLTAFCFYMLRGAFHDFIDSDGIHYFIEKPARMVFVLAIGIAGGLGALVYEQFSLPLRRSLKLWICALFAICFFLFAGYLYWEFHFNFPTIYDPRYFEFVPLVPLACCLYFSILFCLNLKRRIES